MSLAPPASLIPDGASTLVALEGSASRITYTADRLVGLDPTDGRPLLARYDLTAARTLQPAVLAERRAGGMWRWAELLPVRNAVNVVHLGEGGTPLLHARRLGRALRLDRLFVKAEGCNPTGSFKARGMAAAVSRAQELGATAFVVPSAGNAGGALAAYAAAAGLPATVVMPVDAPAANRAEALVCGARVLLVEGDIADCGRLASSIAEATGAFDLATLKEPYRVEGKKTLGFELAEDASDPGWGPSARRPARAAPPWRLPDVVVYPTGGGTGLVGMWKAFEELEELGLIGAARPRMVAVQAEGCAPIVRAFERHTWGAEPWEDPVTRASGIRVPRAIGDALILQALRGSGGTAVAVPEAAIDEHQRLGGRLGVGYIAPETGAVLAAIRVLVEDDWIDPAEEVVAFDTGIGHKYPPPPGLTEPPILDADEADLERLARLLGVR